MKTLLTLFLIIGALVGKVEAQYSYTRGTGTAADPYQIATAEGTNYQKIDTIIINRSYFGGGSGTAADPYLISDTSQLAALARYVNQGNGNATIGAHYALIADLDLTGWGGANGWEAIGIYKTSTDFSKTFQGFFHGKGHRIRNLSLNRENTADQGLFGYVKNMTIDSLRIENANVTANANSGIIAGSVTGNSKLSYCSVTGRMNGTAQAAGGLVGYLNSSSKILNSSMDGDVTGTASNIGGIVGVLDNSSSISNCSMNGNVSGGSSLGGIVGYANRNGSVDACYMNGHVDGGGNDAGGIAGRVENNAVIRSCYAAGSMTSTSNSVGGIVGFLNGGIIKNCYARNTISADIDYAGGLVGCLKLSGSLVENSVALNPSVSTPGTNRGRVLGYAENGVVRNNYASNKLTITKAKLADSLNGLDGVGKKLIELQQLSFYTTKTNWYNGAAWSMASTQKADSTWRIDNGCGFPYFQWQTVMPKYTNVNLNTLITTGKNTLALQPAFHPDTLNYEVNLDTNIITIVGSAACNGSVAGNVSKRFLDRAETLFTLTVTSEDGSQTQAYTILAKLPVYTITANAAANGSISPVDDSTVVYMDSIAYTITPDFGYDIDSVWVNDEYRGNMSTYVMREVSGDSSIFVTFTKHIYTVQSDNGPNGSIDPYGNSAVAYLDSVVYTITPDFGYDIDSVWVNDEYRGNMNEYIIPEVSGDSSIFVSFKKHIYTVQSNNGPNGSIDPYGNSAVAYLDSVVYTITPDFGYDIDSVWVNDEYRGNMNAYIIREVSGDSSIFVTFTKHIYTVQSDNGPNGSIDPYGNSAVAYLDSVVYTITPDFGYDIDSVWVNDEYRGNMNEYIIREVSGDSSIFVSFTKHIYTVQSDNGPNGSIDPYGNSAVAYLDSVVYTITPDFGYDIDSVWVNDEYRGNMNEYVIREVSGDSSIFVTFTKHIYTVTSNNGPNGIIDPSGNTPVAYLDSVVYTITPDFGYDIDSVWVNDEYRGNMNEYIIREVSGDSSIFVSFKKHLFKVTSDNGPNGSIDPYGNSFVAYMDDISYTITPDNGYRIDSVFVNDQYRGHRNTYTFRNVQGDSTIYVTFVEKEDTLNYWNVYTDAGPHGRILPSEDSTVLEGSDVLYTIIPDFGYDVDSVWVNDAYKGNMTEYTIFNICGDSMIRATFKKHLYTLTAIAGPNGTINPAGDTLVAYLDSVVYKMTPAFGYDIDSVFVGGQYQGNDSIYTFRNVQANDTIYVKFTEIITPVTYHTVTAAAGVNGTITPEGDMLIAEGGSISYTIQADSAYAIDSVYINNEYRGKFAFYTFENIQGDSSIYVVFTAIPTPEDPKIIDMVITGDAVLDVPFSPDITTYNVQMPCTREAAFTFFAKEGDTLLIDGEAYLDSVKVLYSGEEGAIEQLIVKMNNTANAAEYTFNLSIPYDSTRIIQPYDNMLEVVNNPEFYDGGEKFKDDGYYQWYLDGQPIPGATNGILYFGSGQTTVANGNYSVEVTYLDGTKNRICPVSFAQPQQVKMLVYPNPTTGKLTVDDGQWTMKGQIKVYNMSGACVGKFVAEGHNTEINIDYLPTGIYVVRAGNKSVTAIKQ